ncbi:MAG: hypothetical protein ACLS69_08460 [Butyricicoccus sp.]
MQNGGHITGWFLPKAGDRGHRGVSSCTARPSTRSTAARTHGLLPYAVGDGNHSMATAKAYWEEVRRA